MVFCFNSDASAHPSMGRPPDYLTSSTCTLRNGSLSGCSSATERRTNPTQLPFSNPKPLRTPSDQPWPGCRLGMNYLAMNHRLSMLSSLGRVDYPIPAVAVALPV